MSGEDWADQMKYTYRKYQQTTFKGKFSYVCFYTVTKYSIMCLSFYSLIVSKDNAYRSCLVSCPEVIEQENRSLCQSRLVAIKNSLKSSSCTWPNGTPEKHLAKRGLFLSNYVSFRIPLKFKACFSSTEIQNFLNISNKPDEILIGDLVMLPISM